MPDPPAGERGGAPPPAAVDRVARFKPPGKLDLNSASLSSRGKCWKEEVELYMDLAMVGKDKKDEKRLFPYLIRSKDREVYESFSFRCEPDD